MNALQLPMQSLLQCMDIHGDKPTTQSVIMADACSSSSHRLQPSRSVMPVS